MFNGREYLLLPPLFFYVMEYTVEELKNKVYEKVFNVYDVFKNHFGEKYVDLQKIPSNESFAAVADNIVDVLTVDDRYVVTDLAALTNACASQYYEIYVWWPNVRITNENNRSIDIQDLYAKITINIYGHIPFECHGFQLNRATYPTVQFISNYLHSHINGIPQDDFSKFKNPCLGSGPIRNTITTLKSNDDTVMWMLFCEELSKYVTVESLKGVPYKKLENVGQGTFYQDHNTFHTVTPEEASSLLIDYRYDTRSPYYLDKAAFLRMLKDFTEYYLRHGHLSFCFEHGKYVCGMSHYEYMVDVSNCFIDYYNAVLKENDDKLLFLYKGKFLLKMVVSNGKFYLLDGYTNRRGMERYQGRYVLTFKGKGIRTKIIEDRSEVTTTTVLNWQAAHYVLTCILRIINFRFKNEHNNNGTDSQGRSTSNTEKAVYYL